MEPGLGATLLVLAAVGAVIYFQADSFTVFQWITKFILLFGFLTFCVQCFGTRWINLLKRMLYKKKDTEDDSNGYEEEELKGKEKLSRDKIQDEYREKAASYKERILDPREENKKRKKEEEYYRFLGPAWKGEGHALGGNAEQYDEDGTARNPADIRQIPDQINEDVARRSREEMEIRKRKESRKVIELPEEPPEGAAGCVVVVLRLPIGQARQRRFCQSNTIENVLDYMTTIGFNKRRYTVYTSFPRRCLTDQRAVTLHDLGFSRKVTLNVEEIEE